MNAFGVCAPVSRAGHRHHGAFRIERVKDKMIVVASSGPFAHEVVAAISPDAPWDMQTMFRAAFMASKRADRRVGPESVEDLGWTSGNAVIAFLEEGIAVFGWIGDIDILVLGQDGAVQARNTPHTLFHETPEARDGEGLEALHNIITRSLSEDDCPDSSSLSVPLTEETARLVVALPCGRLAESGAAKIDGVANAAAILERDGLDMVVVVDP